MTNAVDKKRRTSLLVSLYFDPLTSATALAEELETVHGITASADLIRADLTWLSEMGLARFDGRVASVTERGKDVARNRAPFPGDA